MSHAVRANLLRIGDIDVSMLLKESINASLYLYLLPALYVVCRSTRQLSTTKDLLNNVEILYYLYRCYIDVLCLLFNQKDN